MPAVFNRQPLKRPGMIKEDARAERSDPRRRQRRFRPLLTEPARPSTIMPAFPGAPSSRR